MRDLKRLTQQGGGGGVSGESLSRLGQITFKVSG